MVAENFHDFPFPREPGDHRGLIVFQAKADGACLTSRMPGCDAPLADIKEGRWSFKFSRPGTDGASSFEALFAGQRSRASRQREQTFCRSSRMAGLG